MAQISVRVDDDGKHSAEQTYELPADPFYSESNMRYLEQKMADYKAGRLNLTEHALIEDQSCQ